jgi:hypothetical protein
VRRIVVSTVLSILLVLGLAANVVMAQPRGQPPPAQDEFVPVTDLPPAEQLPAAPLVAAAYGFIWVAALGYLWMIWRRLGAVDRELATLRRQLGTRP